jgi:hypothetical protein
MDYQVRRSARLSPHSTHNSTSAPAFRRTSQSSSTTTTTTSYPSPTDDSERAQNPSETAHHLQYAPHLTFQPSMSQSNLDAPHPSPSAGDMNSFFARPHPQPNPYQPMHSHHQQQQHEQQQATSNPHANQNASAPHHGSFSQNSNKSNPPGALPADFLMEAAKRAQMACLMRDLGDVSL